MTILIAKVNEPIIENYIGSIKFKEASKNTSTFNLDEKTFLKLREWVKSQGYNPYALMNW